MSTATDPTEPVPAGCPLHGAIGPRAPEGLCPHCLLDFDGGDDDAPESLPVQFGPYELLARLGEGGMGVVYKARQVSVDRVVALKRIRDGELADAKARRRFYREARDAAKLDHARIVPLYDVGEHGGQPYFTMKLMPGGTLEVARDRFAEPRRAAALIATLARAVHAGHRQHVIHRDLKPENILFDDHGEPYIADFGIAKRLDHNTRTMTGTILGTVGYMAPEQTTRGHPMRDSASADIWSLGVILYELLAGRRPFDGPTLLEVMRRTHEEEPVPLERLRRDVSRDLSTVCLTCLHKDPARRYISAEALADDLDRYLSGKPTRVRRPSPGRRALAWCRRHPFTAVLLGVAALALVTLTLWSLAGTRAQEQARRAEVLAANRYAARAVAGTVLALLDEYATTVAKEAQAPQLTTAMALHDGEALQGLSEGIRARHAGFAYWFIIDAGGTLQALVPSEQSGKPSVTNFAFRDYFRGAMSLAVDRPAYISRAFRSATDNRYKIAIAAPIRGADGRPLGLLAAEIATDRRLGAIELSDDHRVAVLTVRRDRESSAEPLPKEHILWVHGGVEHGEGVVVKSDALRRLTARRDTAGDAGSDQLRLPPPDWVELDEAYRDPLDQRGTREAGGPWLVGVAAVGRTELAVMVQTRVEDATALDRTPLRVYAAWSVGGVLLLLASLFATLRGTRRRANA
ncbi:serine/threonine protein kinase [Polyangium sp. 6x1]|uniref:serine/threonine protein kinase n=1 Tax=Polyangium sp. 6x1 TaxID=3042689 RepID=UPI002482F6F1|nr:serine/threonine protein kinase [Polyangium sp. 6x1]MDI1449660.1 serine/threonine protein kinase [Polyangium sp. 6x1]